MQKKQSVKKEMFSWVSLDEILKFLQEMPSCDLTRRIIEHIPQEYRSEIPTAHNLQLQSH